MEAVRPRKSKRRANRRKQQDTTAAVSSLGSEVERKKQVSPKSFTQEDEEAGLDGSLLDELDEEATINEVSPEVMRENIDNSITELKTEGDSVQTEVSEMLDEGEIKGAEREDEDNKDTLTSEQIESKTPPDETERKEETKQEAMDTKQKIDSPAMNSTKMEEKEESLLVETPPSDAPQLPLNPTSSSQLVAVPSAPNFDHSDGEDGDSTGMAQSPPFPSASFSSPSPPTSFTEITPSAPPDLADLTLSPSVFSSPDATAPSAPQDESPPMDDTESTSPAPESLQGVHEVATAPDVENIQVETPSAPVMVDENIPTAPDLEHEETPEAPSAPDAEMNKDEVPSAPLMEEESRVEQASAQKEVSTKHASATSYKLRQVSTRQYPEIPDAETLQSAKQKELPNVSHEEKTSLHHVYIKLEPHVNYEMNLLRAEAAQKRQEKKMQHIGASKGDLYRLVEKYLFSEYLVHTACTHIQSSRNKTQELLRQVWSLDKRRISATKRCGDNIEIKHEMDFTTAKLDPAHMDRLRDHQDALRQARTTEASMHVLDRALSFFHVEEALSNVLEDTHLVTFVNQRRFYSQDDSSEFEVVPSGANFYEALEPGTDLCASVDALKQVIDVLIYFEKAVTVDDGSQFARLPAYFNRGEVVWQAPESKSPSHKSSGMLRQIKCFACGSLNEPMPADQSCRMCRSCQVLLYLPSTSVSTSSSDWVAAVGRFRQSLQHWIATCLQTLLRTKLLSNTPYVLMHVMYLPRVSTEDREWALRFLQFPRRLIQGDGSVTGDWTEDLVDHYLAMVHLVFHPEKLRRMATMVSSSPSHMSRSQRIPNDRKVSPEWVLLENPETLDKWFLSDDDFVAIVNQFPHTLAFYQIFRCSYDTKKCFNRALTLVLELTQSLRTFQEFEKFPIRVADLLAQLLESASHISVGTQTRSKTAKDALFYPTLLDQLFLTALHGLLAPECSRASWQQLKAFPFSALSALAKWDVLSLLLFYDHQPPTEAKSVVGWLSFAEQSRHGSDASGKTRRQVLHERVQADAEHVAYLLEAVASLAACTSGEDEDGRALVTVAVKELFFVGFTEPSCRIALGEEGDQVAPAISTVCLTHPWALSHLISLLFKYHECAGTWVKLFQTLPVNRWTPTLHDLSTLQSWLFLQDTCEPRAVLARFLLDHVNWEFDLKEQTLFTPAALHRQVALILAEALVLHKARRLHPREPVEAVDSSRSQMHYFTKSIRRALWLEQEVDFEAWCWRLMLKLRFHSPLSHAPLLEPIDLVQDKSREALMLRRWFASASAALSSELQIPFYASLETQVQRLGRKSQAETRDERLEALQGSDREVLDQYDNSNPLYEKVESTGTNESDETKDSSTLTTDPIVAYVICQITTFLYSSRLDRWEPLVILLQNNQFAASVQVIQNVLAVRAKLHLLDHVVGSEAEARVTFVEWEEKRCMKALESLSLDDLLRLLHVLYKYAYINEVELRNMEEILQNGYIMTWEQAARKKVLARLRFVRNHSRFVHPIALPSLADDTFPLASAGSLSTTALLHGAMSWLWRHDKSTGPLASADATSITELLSIRSSSLIPVARSSSTIGIMSSSPEEGDSIRSLCMALQREMELCASGMEDTIRTWFEYTLETPVWFEHPGLRKVMDVLLQGAMNQYMRKQSKRHESLLWSLLSGLVVAFKQYCSKLEQVILQPQSESEVGVDAERPPVVSFLPASSPSLTFQSLFGGALNVAQYVGSCPSLSFWSLMVETRQEAPLLSAFGQLMIQHEPETMSTLERMALEEGDIAAALHEVGLSTLPSESDEIVTDTVRQEKALRYAHTTFDTLAEFKFYRWCEYCLELPEEEPLQVLFWQVLFALYFASDSCSRFFGHHFLERSEVSRGQSYLRQNLQKKLRMLSSHCSTQAQMELTAASGVDAKDKKYTHLLSLSQLYTAMDAWLEDSDPNKWMREDQIDSLPRHFEAQRLRQVLSLSAALLCDANDMTWDKLPLWLNLCGLQHASRSSYCDNGNDDVVSMSNTDDTTGSNNELFDDDYDFIETFSTFRTRAPSVGEKADSSGLPLPPTRQQTQQRSLTSLPTANVQVTESSCVLSTSPALNAATLKQAATQFSETLSTLVALDAELMDHTTKLYASKPRTVTQSRACLEGTSCSSPAIFRLEFMEWSRDADVSEAIDTVLVHADRCDFSAMQPPNLSVSLSDAYDGQQVGSEEVVDLDVPAFLGLDQDTVALCRQLLLIDRIVQALDVQMPLLEREKEETKVAGTTEEEAETVDVDKKLARLQEKGLEWFRELTKLDTKLARMLPSLREALWRAIRQLGANFVGVNAQETAALLDLMLDDPTRIDLLSPCFFPAAAPSRFVQLFSKLLSASSASKLSSEQKLAVLRRFDFSSWLQQATPSKFDLETVLSIVLGDLTAQFPADRLLLESWRGGKETAGQGANAHMRELLQIYSNVVKLVCSERLEDHLERVVKALVGVHDDYRFANTTSLNVSDDSSDIAMIASLLPRPVDATAWEAFVNVPDACWNRLSFIEIESVVSFLSQHVSSIRWKCAGKSEKLYPLVYLQTLGVLKSLLELFATLIKHIPQKRQWGLITTFYEPLLSTLYEPASANESSSRCCPWNEEESASTGSTLCASFVGICREYLSPIPDDDGSIAPKTDKLTQLWTFYLEVLVPNAPAHVCKLLHQFLTRLGWEHWVLTLEVVQQMRESIECEKTEASAPYPYVSWMVREVLCRLTWDETEAWLEKQEQTIVSNFLLTFAKLCIDLIIDFPPDTSTRSGALRSNSQSSSSSANRLPPYLVNFVKQQSALWRNWELETVHLQALLDYAKDTVLDPLQSNDNRFQHMKSPPVIQDAFARLQLAFRLLSEITTTEHQKLPPSGCFDRIDQFLAMIYTIFEQNDKTRVSAAFDACGKSGWLMALLGASCTVLYEKLDELVQLCKHPEQVERVGDRPIEKTIIGILRFCNLSLVDDFFATQRSASTPTISATWTKNGNVILVELDGLVRDFASNGRNKKKRRPRRNSGNWSDSSPCSSGGEESSSIPADASSWAAVEAIGDPLGRLLWSFLGFRGGELCCLSACGRAVASVHVMSQVSEKSIERWLIEERRGGWEDVVSKLTVPELSVDEFEEACLESGSLLTLQVLFLQQLKQAPTLTESVAVGLVGKLLAWIQQFELPRNSGVQVERKVMYLAAELSNVVNVALAPHLSLPVRKQTLRQLAERLLVLGDERKNHGLMKAIGMGGALAHGVEFHLSAMVSGIYLRLQTKQSTPLRDSDRVPLHVSATTEAEIKKLEQLMGSKDCLQLGKRVEWLLQFARDPNRSLADQDEFFVSLFARMYPSQSWLLVKSTI